MRLLVLMLPLGMAAAVSPMMLAQQLVVMAGPRGRRAGSAYAAGAASVAAAVVLVVVAVGRSLELPTAPHLDASLDLVLGVALSVGAAVVHSRGRTAHRSRPARPPRTMRPSATYGYGLFSMATNLTTLSLLVPAAKEVAAADADVLAKVVAAVVLVAFACVPTWLPLAVMSAAPRSGERLLAALQGAIERHGRAALVLVLAAAGVYLLLRGIVRLV
nr:GAP family protein [Nocardioides flavescens]